MFFGVFDHMDQSGPTLAEQYDQRLKLIEAYDRAGFRGYHLAEHHSTPLGLSPSPSVFLAAASQRTKRLRLGALVFTLSLYHPLRLLEEVCMLDALTNGRLDLGIGRGVSPIELGFFGLDVPEAQERYLEASDILMMGLTSKTINHEGKHFRFRNVPVELTPVQKAVPLWYGAARPDTAEWAARKNINIICNGSAASVGEITHRFRSTWEALGHRPDAMPLAGMSRHVVVADTDTEALAIAKPAYEQWFSSLDYLWRLNGLKLPLRLPERFEEANAAGFCLVGSPATVRTAMSSQFKETGINYLLCRLAFGNLTLQQSLKSVGLMEQEIMPAFSATISPRRGMSS
jgi:alkanesulfonate monooxygenase SsuD/methylene tetrahydromethanopterin reductase-like flavin-dependent oxidoreductase (luciferase family)